MNNIITASRMAALQRCARMHYWSYEIGLRRVSTGLALRIGSAWARGMEARWKGLSYDDALAAAVPEGIDLTEYDLETVAALLAGYYDYYQQETVFNAVPEVEFDLPLTRGFRVAGKIDALGSLADGRTVKIEAKTTSDDIEDQGSEYWLRLAFNMQVYQYVLAAREMGWDVTDVIYDVTRKPSIKPKLVDDLDSNGLKIVIDAQGSRIMLKNGEPRQSGDTAKGYVVKRHTETPAEYSERLWQDTKMRPGFYFQRREVPILEDQLAEFKLTRLALVRLIREFRRNEKKVKRPEQAWPRTVGRDSCSFCQYKSFCLQNLSVNVECPPEGYTIQQFNPELAITTEDNETSGTN